MRRLKSCGEQLGRLEGSRGRVEVLKRLDSRPNLRAPVDLAAHPRSLAHGKQSHLCYLDLLPLGRSISRSHLDLLPLGQSDRQSISRRREAGAPVVPGGDDAHGRVHGGARWRKHRRAATREGDEAGAEGVEEEHGFAGEPAFACVARLPGIALSESAELAGDTCRPTRSVAPKLHRLAISRAGARC